MQLPLTVNSIPLCTKFDSQEGVYSISRHTWRPIFEARPDPAKPLRGTDRITFSRANDIRHYTRRVFPEHPESSRSAAAEFTLYSPHKDNNVGEERGMTQSVLLATGRISSGRFRWSRINHTSFVQVISLPYDNPISFRGGIGSSNAFPSLSHPLSFLLRETAEERECALHDPPCDSPTIRTS